MTAFTRDYLTQHAQSRHGEMLAASAMEKLAAAVTHFKLAGRDDVALELEMIIVDVREILK